MEDERQSVDKTQLLQKPSGDGRPARSAKSMKEAVPRSLSAKARVPAANDDSACSGPIKDEDQ